ncbi:MAG: hypothetical protein HQM16_16670, partial [Deltaproteobacteria bacterium]|nr:hypothetical protein [Deltaproteobacteria bacterium]
VGFEGDNEVTIETYGGNDEIHIHCNRGELSHWLVINAGAGDDKVFGSHADEWIFGDEGVDVLFGDCTAGCEAKRTCLPTDQPEPDAQLQGPVTRQDHPELLSTNRDLMVAGSDELVPVAKPEGPITAHNIKDFFRKEYLSRGSRTEEIYCGDNALCAVIGSNMSDCIRGAVNGTTMVYADDGADDIQTFSGDDVIHGGGGDDWIQLGGGDDQAFGGRGDDYLIGEAGDDRLGGGSEADTLVGGSQNDVLCGGEGGDSVDGGDGEDRADSDSSDELADAEPMTPLDCFVKNEKQKVSANRLQPNHLTDWMGLPRYRMIGGLKIPKGFTGALQFDQFVAELKFILAELKITDAKIVIMGSAVDGIASMGKPFRYAGPDRSDLDVSVHSDMLVESLKQFRIDQTGHVKKTAIYEVYPAIRSLANNWGSILERNVSIYALPPGVHKWRNVIVVE